MKGFFERLMIVLHYTIWVLGIIVVIIGDFNSPEYNIIWKLIIGFGCLIFPTFIWWLFSGKPRIYPWSK